MIGTLTIKKLRPHCAKVNIRQINKISTDQWLNEFNTNSVELTDKLDTLTHSLKTEFTRVLKTLAPEKVCKVNLRLKKPWYDTDLKDHKHQVRKLEKKWLKYKNEGCLTAYKKCHNCYYGKLNTKKSVLQFKFQDCGKDSRRLHVLMSNLTTKQTEKLLPSAKAMKT